MKSKDMEYDLNMEGFGLVISIGSRQLIITSHQQLKTGQFMPLVVIPD